MGNRHDHLLDDDRADAAMRRVLASVGEPVQIEPPPDLVSRTLRRLPAVPPARAARVANARRVLRGALAFGFGALLLALVLLNLLGGFTPNSPLMSMLGDGGSGIGRVLLTLHLLAKPLLRSITTDSLVLLGSALVALAGGWLWWTLIRRTPIAVAVEARS
ncbi:MAG TPA: hypothetical protein VFS21_06710 [Roseiflexaceae bacterium]|nr:hypothetical protein [Roseiflexaceae bacterium]